MVLLYRLLRRKDYRASRARHFDAAHPPVPLRWRPRLRVYGLLSGVLGGVGSVVLFAQYGIEPVTNGAFSVRGALGGAISGIVLPSAIFAVVVWRFNRRLARGGGRPGGGNRIARVPAPRAAAVLALVGASGVVALAGVGRAGAVVNGPCRAEFAGIDATGATTSAGDAIEVPEQSAVTYAMAAPEDLETWRFWLEYGPFTQLVAEGDRDEPNPNDRHLGLRPEDDFVIDFTGILGEPVVDGNSVAGTVATEDYAWMGAGLYEVHGEVTTIGGTTCDGVILIDVGGNPLATVLGAAAAGAAAIGLAGAGLVSLGGLRDGGELLDALDRYDSDASPEETRDGDGSGDVDLVDWVDRWAGGASDNPLTVFDRATGGPGSASCQGLPRFSVNTATLNLVVEDTVFAYRGLGPPVEVRLTHNAATTARPPLRSSLGHRWRLTYDAEVHREGRLVRVHKGSGHALLYELDERGRAGRALDGSPDRLHREGDRWQLVEDATDLVLGFAPAGMEDRWLLADVGDTNGNVVRVGRRDDGALASVTDAAGRVTRFEADAAGRVLSMVTPDGRTARFDYSTDGDLVGTIDMLGIDTAYSYDDAGRVTTISVDGGRHLTRFAYQRGDAVRSVTDAGGNVTEYEIVHDSPRVVEVTDPARRTMRYESAGGRTTAVAAGTGVHARFQHDETGRLVGFDGTGGATMLAYDEGGHLVGETARGARTTYSYDDEGRIVAEHGPSGALSSVRDDRGNVVRLDGPDASSLQLERDGSGQVVSLVDAAGARTVIDRDVFGNVVGVTDPSGATTRIQFDPHGLRVEAVTDANGHTTRYEHDANGRPTRLVHPDGTERTWRYSCCAAIATTDAAGRTIRLSRDPLLRVAEEVAPSGSPTIFEFDPSGLLVGVRDALGRETRRERDASGRLVAVQDGAGSSIRFEHDGRGLLTAVVDALGHRTEYERDEWGNPVVVREPGRRLSFAFDAEGRATKTTNGRGQTVEVHSRADGLPTRVETSEGGITDFEHDSCGAVVGMAGAWGRTTLERDGLGRPVAVRDSSGAAVELAYDPVGNLSSIRYAGGLEVTYDHDERDRVRRVSWPSGRVELTRDEVGQVVEERRSNGTTTAYRYDVDGAVVAIVHAGAGGAFVDLAYKRDAVGNVVAVDGFAPIEIAPDAATTTYAHGSAGELVIAGGSGVDHDGDGNVVGAGTGWTASYDAENHLVELARDGVTTRLAYDGLGRLVAVDGPETFRLLRDPGGRPLMKLGADGTVECCYIWRDGALIGTVGADGDVLFDHHDTTGHLLARTDGRGEVVAAFAHDPFGGRMAARGEIGHLFTFCGQHGVVALGDGFYAMGPRVYHAPTGRFLQRDPLGLAGGFDPYGYAEANPVSIIDPGGMKGFAEWLNENLPHDRITGGIQRAADTFDHYFGSWVRSRARQLRHPINVPVRHLERHNRGEAVRVTPGQARRELGEELKAHAEDLADHVGPPGASGARAALQAARQAADGDLRGMVETMGAEAEPFLEEHGGATGNAMHRIKETIDGVGSRADQLRRGVDIYRTCPIGRR